MPGDVVPRILIVDDEPEMVRGLEDNLRFEGYQTIAAGDGRRGLALALSEAPDLILLDVMMPGMSGWDVCRELRARGLDTPVIMLTARGAEVDRVQGLELGADDYVTKPFSPIEVVARVKAVLRRMQAAEEPDRPLRAGPVQLEPATRRATLDGREVDLTRLEFDLLAELAAHPRIVYTRERLLEKVWGYEVGVGGKTVDVHVANLRRKLGEDIGIRAVRGVGYKLDPESAR